MNTPTLTWAPSPDTARKLLAGFFIGTTLLGLIGFSVSYWSVVVAAQPYMGEVSWTLPLMIDLGIFLLTGLSLFLEMHQIRSRWVRLIPLALALFTMYLNTATQPALFGKALHSAGPGLWIAIVEIGSFTVRRLTGLYDERRIEGLRRSLWVLRPWATWRLWRQMRIHQITTYRAALDRDAARATIIGRMRINHGRMWRAKAPLSERIALRLDGRDVEGVADILRTHADTAALLSAPAGHPDTMSATETGADRARPDTRQAVAELVATRPDMSTREIAEATGVSDRTVRRHLSTLTTPIQHANGHHTLEAAP